MKCLCFSDSHGSDFEIRRALSKHPDAEIVFFLGDGLSDVEKYFRQGRIWYAVRGNCDHSPVADGSLVPKTLTVNLSGYRITLTHGDLFGVKGGMGGLRSLAKSESAGLVLYGHTHTPHSEYVDGVYYFNPGSISSYAYSNASYGVITLTDSGILLSHGAADPFR